MSKNFLRLPAVIHETGCSRAMIYLRIKQRLWPKPIPLGIRMVGWLSCEVSAMNAARVAGKSDDEIRFLVAELEAARKAYA
jgi:prophage regulatory protein